MRHTALASRHPENVILRSAVFCATKDPYFSTESGPQRIRLLHRARTCSTTNDQRLTARHSVTNHSSASSRLLKIGNSRCQKTFKFFEDKRRKPFLSIEH